MLTKRPHPSNRLYRGECTGFVDAMETVERMVNYELEDFRRFMQSDGIPESESDRRCNDSLRAMRKAAIEARCQYVEEVGRAEKAFFQRLAGSADEYMKSFGQAALSGSYEGLAI